MNNNLTALKNHDKIPQFLIDAVQGVTFWIGHRRAIYRHYPLSESALVTELCNLLQTNLPDNNYLFPEVMYKKLSNNDYSDCSFGQKRADISIFCPSEKSEKQEVSNLKYVIEVKKWAASKKEINKDLLRLICQLNCNPNARCFLIVISEQSLPKDYVSEDGIAIRGKQSIISEDNTHAIGYYQVRRVLKASSGFKQKHSGHFGCILEVFLSIETGK